MPYQFMRISRLFSRREPNQRK